MDVKGAFTEKIGPLPAIAWAGMAGGTFVVYRYIQARKHAATSATETVVDTQGEGFGLNQDSASPWGSTGGGGGSSVVTPTTTTGSPQSNVDWGTLAQNWGIGQGFNPTDVATALGAYLYGTGQTLNSTQSGILQTILHQFGTPPEGVIIPPPTTNAPPLTNTPPSAPTPTQPSGQNGNVSTGPALTGYEYWQRLEAQRVRSFAPTGASYGSGASDPRSDNPYT
jgi:hypothetical protein